MTKKYHEDLDDIQTLASDLKRSKYTRKATTDYLKEAFSPKMHKTIEKIIDETYGKKK